MSPTQTPPMWCTAGQRAPDRAEPGAARAATQDRARVPARDRAGRGAARVAQADHAPGRRPRRLQDRRGEHLRRAGRRARSTCSTRTTAARTPTASNIPDPWTSLAADPNIQFALATKDPKGKRPTASPARRPTRDSFGTGDTVKRRPAAALARGRPTATSTSGSATSATGCSATRSSRAARPDRRRRDPLHRVRHHGRRRRAVQPRPHRDPRGRPLAEPAPHLGRQDRLLGLRPGLRHPARADAQLRQARLAAHLLQQRPERRHVHELHGLRRRRRDVHVHPGPGRAHERDAGGAAQEDRGAADDRARAARRAAGCTPTRRTPTTSSSSARRPPATSSRARAGARRWSCTPTAPTAARCRGRPTSRRRRRGDVDGRGRQARAAGPDARGTVRRRGCCESAPR